jgi:hypothetical protein
MARRGAKRGLKGAGDVRRLLKNMPDAVKGEIVSLYQSAAPKALSIARAGAPVRTGALRSALSAKVFPKSIRLRVGLLGKAVNRRLFYGRILEVGRKAQTVRARRRSGGGTSTYAMRISPIPAARYDIVQGRARRSIRALITGPLRGIWEKALRRAAFGGTDG